MQQKLIRYFFAIVLAATSLSATAQETIPLVTFLQQVEQRFDVSFSYLDKDLEGISIVPLLPESTIADIKNKLNEIDGLTVTEIDESTFAISFTTPIGKICAYILDRENGEPIKGALISWKNQNTISSEEGYFEFESYEDSATISLSHLSYGQLFFYVSSSSRSCDTIYLTMTDQQLDPVSFQYVITSGIKYDGASSIELDNKNLSILPGMTEPDVFHSLQVLPGVMSLDESASNINIRGGSNDQNLFLWNGSRLYQTGHFFGLFSAINPFSVQKTTITLAGTQPAFDRSASSTVAIDTSPESSAESKLEGGFNGINADLTFTSLPSDRLTISGSARAAYNELLATPTYNRYDQRAFANSELGNSGFDSTFSQQKDFSYYDLSTSLLYSPGKSDKIRLDALVIRNDLQFGQSGLVDTLTTTQQSELQQNSYLISAEYQKKLGKGDLIFGTYNSIYQLAASDDNGVTGQTQLQSNNIQDYGLRLDYAAKLTNDAEISMGYFWNEVGIENVDELINPSFRQARKNVLRTHSLYGSVSRSFVQDKLELSGGIRANYFEQYQELLLLPRLALTYALSKTLSTSLSYESKSQTVSQIINFQTDFLGIEKRRWVFTEERGSNYISSNQLTAGARFEKNRLLVNLEAYQKEVDGILATSQEFVNQFEFSRAIGSYDTQGFDLLVTWRNPIFDIWGSYSLANTRYRFDSLQPPNFSSNFDIRNYLTTGASYKRKGLKLSVGAKYRTGRQHTEATLLDPQSEAILFQAPNSSNLPPYFRLDLSGSYEFLVGKNSIMQLGASFWNLTNHQNVLQRYYTVGQQGTLEILDQKGLSFLPNFNIRITL